jgi:signal transduction histidine kinase
VYLLNDRGAIYAVGHPRASTLGHLAALAELVALAGLTFVALLAGATVASWLAGRAPLSGRALMRQVRASFYRTLFLAFVAAVVVPVVALALVTRAYMATSLYADIEGEAARTAASASRVVEDFASIETRGAGNLPVLDDSLLVWLSRVIGEDINVFAGTGLLASSERNLFASGLLPTRTPGAVYRALALDGRSSYLARESVGTYEYLVASAPVRVDDRPAIVSVPLTLRQRGIERQLDELDRRVLLAAIAFILLGSAIGYWAAERISDPVSRLTRATQRLAAGDLDARVLVTSADELGRLVEAFNGMAEDLQRQRAQLERTNRLEAWAEMARQVAHDIKNPLTPIQLNAEHLRRVHADQGRPLGPVVDDCIANLLRQIASEFSSFASSPQARPEPTALAPLVDELLQPYVIALAGRIAIDAATPSDLPEVRVDRVLLSRALTNVVENALHAMPGRGTLRVRAQVASPGVVEVSVTDTGVGMDAAALARIFEPYFSTKATGTGLGLTIARRNVELNGGTIAVASTPGRGTTVTMQIPAA